MKHRSIRYFLPALLLLLAGATGTARASHFYGADLFYTHQSGNTYQISLVVYGDCAGSAFPLLQNGAPQVDVYKNGTQFQTTLNLSQSGPGVEVTPVCPSQVNNTTCNGGSVPGVKRYTYTTTYTLNGTSTNWRFVTNGNMGNNSLAGRSNSISNIATGTGSIMILEATLNNTVGSNSSPTYTTIPTPFFCINKPAQYNPGAVDPNADSLGFALVDGLQVTQTSTVVTNVTYVAPYSATAPLGTAAGTFSFSATTGQLAFTPNIVQQSLVVSRVSEYRNGVLVGTSMREMTFVVLNNCNNNPPGGTISNPAGGTTTGNTSIQVCQSQGLFSFSINPTDVDGDPINVVAAGVPAGATFTINGNNTTAPSTTFSWDVTNVPAGSYSFFITYTDDGCPLSSRQTLAYTITVLPTPTINAFITHPATCTKRAAFTAVTGGQGGAAPYTFTVSQGSTVVSTFTTSSSSVSDSLYPGTYTIRVTNSNTCFKEVTLTAVAPVQPAASAVTAPPTCNAGANGSITLTPTAGLAPYQYALGAGAYGSTSTFSGLASGSYIIHIKDANDCVKDTTVVIAVTPPINAAVSLVEPPCNAFQSGSITVNGVNGAAPYTYALGASGTFSSTNVFAGLGSGFYLIRIRDANLCSRDTLVLLPDSVSVKAPATLTPILCNGDSTAVIVLNAFGTAAPYTYALSSGAATTNNTFSGLPAGSYTFHIADPVGCYLDTTVVITQPTAIVPVAVAIDVTCPGGTDGQVSVTATGGTPGYTYALNSGAFGAATSFTALAAGTYVLSAQDANACVRTDTVDVIQPPPISIAATAVNPTCPGGTNGSASMTLTGGTPPYFYALGSGVFGSSNTFTGLGAGTYVVHGKDGNGCERDTTLTLVAPPAIIPTVAVTNSICGPLNNGSITVSATGGTPGFTYAVGTGAYGTSGIFSPLASGIYVVHSKDAAGCIKDTTVVILDSLDVVAAVTVTPAVCYDSLNGAFTAIASGGASPYQYAAGSGAFSPTSTFANLHAGTYILHVKDTLGCTLDTSITVTQPTRIQPLATLTQPLCFGDSNGIIQMTPSGGTPSYTHALGNGPFVVSPTFSGLPAGTYIMHVQDAAGCRLDTVLNLGQPAPVVITSVTGTAVLCAGGNSGTITVAASGGVPGPAGYAYSADGGAFGTSPTLTGLTAGPHTIAVRDANGCTRDTTYSLTEPLPLRFAMFFIQNPTCEGFTDGRIVIGGGGGTPPYQYARNGGTYGSQTSYSLLPAGVYTLSIKDANGCVKDTAVTLEGYPVIRVQDQGMTPVRCWGDANGAIDLVATGGLAHLTYQIIKPAPAGAVTTISSWDSLAAGAYTIRLKDSGGCIKDTVITVTTPDDIEIEKRSTLNDCEGYDDGGIARVIVTGGTEPYTYAWSNFPARTGNEIRNLANGFYPVTVTDATGCTDTATLRVDYNNCCLPFIPTAFSPNGDGRNDRFNVRYKGDMTLRNLSIYNRFGQRVFYTTSTLDSWDGRVNGQVQDAGVYFYYAVIVCGNAGTNVIEFKGDITLVR